MYVLWCVQATGTAADLDASNGMPSCHAMVSAFCRAADRALDLSARGACLLVCCVRPTLRRIPGGSPLRRRQRQFSPARRGRRRHFCPRRALGRGFVRRPARARPPNRPTTGTRAAAPPASCGQMPRGVSPAVPGARRELSGSDRRSLPAGRRTLPHRRLALHRRPPRRARTRDLARALLRRAVAARPGLAREARAHEGGDKLEHGWRGGR